MPELSTLKPNPALQLNCDGVPEVFGAFSSGCLGSTGTYGSRSVPIYMITAIWAKKYPEYLEQDVEEYIRRSEVRLR